MKKNTLCLSAILPIGLLVYLNINTEYFWKANLYNVLTLIGVIGVSYYLTQERNDRRILYKMIEETKVTTLDLLNEIPKMIDDDFDRRKYTMSTKKINNKISLIKHCCNRIGIKDEVEYIEIKFRDVEQMVGNHINSIEELKSCKIDIENMIENIETRMDNIFKKMY